MSALPDVQASMSAETRSAAVKMNVPALLVLYLADEAGEIRRFRVRRVSPSFTDFVSVEPAALRRWIERKHDEHVCAPRLEVAA